MIKIIIFDLDGVLVDTNYIHFETFIKALQNINKSINYTYEEHELLFNTLTTKLKVEKLVTQNILNKDDFDIIYNKKQELTKQYLDKLNKNQNLIDLFNILKQKYKLYCCSNSNRINVVTILTNLGLYDYFENIYSNNDVINPKPSPEIYIKTIKLANVSPDETLILEDSEIGLKAAYESNAHVLQIKNINEVTYKNIMNKISNIVYH